MSGTRSTDQDSLSHSAYSAIVLLILVAMLTPFVAAQASKSRPTESFQILARRAEEARASDDIDRAIPLYRQALALKPTWAEGWFYLGTLHYDHNHYELASKAFRKAVQLQPTSGTAKVMLGLSEFQLGQDDLAIKHLEEGEELGISNNAELRRTVLLDEALLLQRKSRFEAARKPLDILCRDSVPGEDVLRLLGKIQLRMRADQSSSAMPDVLLRVGKAGCFAAQKRFDEARAEYSSVVAQYPRFNDIHYAYGNFLIDVPDIPAAKKELEAEIANNPDHVLARLKIASALYRINSAEGISFAEQAVKLDPTVALGHYLLGLLLLDVDQYQRAIPELELAKPGFAKEPKLYFALGSAYARAGRAEDAEQARKEFQRLDKLQKEKEQLQK